jgi:hypothetical protein
MCKTVSDIQRESQAVLDSIKENEFHMHGKNDGIATYVPKETNLKEMAAKIKLSEHFFFDLVRGLSDRTSYFYFAIREHVNDYMDYYYSILFLHYLLC